MWLPSPLQEVSNMSETPSGTAGGGTRLILKFGNNGHENHFLLQSVWNPLSEIPGYAHAPFRHEIAYFVHNEKKFLDTRIVSPTSRSLSRLQAAADLSSISAGVEKKQFSFFCPRSCKFELLNQFYKLIDSLPICSMMS